MVTSVIFDMDGVLIDSEPIHQKTELNALAAFGLQLDKTGLAPLAGTTREAFKKGIEERYGFRPDWDALFEHKDRHFFALMNQVETVPHVIPLLQSIRRSPLRLALATSGQERSVRFVLDKFSLDSLFDVVVCARDVIHSKPDPEIFLTAAHRLQVDPSTCVVFEDSVNGIRAANAAGMYSIGITTTFSEDTLHEADRIIHGFDEISVDDLLAL